mmetsp:Transcript_18553/g.38116  ORF Transcript_18553/g.38116 Transcript_18553/m.38116 type:complete len:586 (+) Transcript_18553:112-1869(+)
MYYTMVCNIRKSTIENPYKERRVPGWIRYRTTGVCCLLIGWFLFGGSIEVIEQKNGSAIASSSVIGPDYHLRRPLTQVNDVDDDEENYNKKDDDEFRLPQIQLDDDNEGNYNEKDVVDDQDRGWSRLSGKDDDEDQQQLEEENQEEKTPLDDDNDEEEGEFPSIEQDQFLDWIRSYYQQLDFADGPPPPPLFDNTDNPQQKLTKSLLSESLALGCDYMVHNQKTETGNFNYQYDFVEDKLDDDDSPVRQAGALWGTTLCFQSMPETFSYQTAVENGIAFFQKHTVDGPIEGSRMIVYPGFENESQSGVNALYGLALIDYLVTIRENPKVAEQVQTTASSLRDLETELTRIIRFLKYLQNEDGHFSEAYDLEQDEKSDEHSSYYDGETMLCLVKAARYLGDDHKDLIPLIERTAPILAKAYTIDAWRDDVHDSDHTKGFYQWSSMVFKEYYLAEWEDYEYFGDCLLVLAHWIIHTHGVLNRPRNTGYAFEGILSAYKVAEMRGQREAIADLAYAIDEGLYKLTGWQVGGPLAHTNKFLVSHPTDEGIAIGGIMNSKHDAPLRIDTTQHQMHAVMMALETLFVRTRR